MKTKSSSRKYKVVQIWPGLFVCNQVTVCPGHIWTTLYFWRSTTCNFTAMKGISRLNSRRYGGANFENFRPNSKRTCHCNIVWCHSVYRWPGFKLQTSSYVIRGGRVNKRRDVRREGEVCGYTKVPERRTWKQHERKCAAEHGVRTKLTDCSVALSSNGCYIYPHYNNE